jgi:hypothetical protein
MSSLPHERDQADFPAYWDWTDGPVKGAYVRMESGPTEFGTRPILIVDVNGVQRSVWINAAALRSKLAEELDRRKARDLTPGEHIEIRRGAEMKTSVAGREYWPFYVNFPDAPRSDAASLLGVDDDDSDDDDEPLPPAAAADDDIPF